MNRWSGRLLIWPVWALAGSYSDDPQSDIYCQLSGQDNCIIISLLLFYQYVFIHTHSTLSVTRTIILSSIDYYRSCLLPWIDGTIWTISAKTWLFCSKALCPRRALFVFVAPGYLGQPQCTMQCSMHSFVLWRCMWKELAPLDQPSTKCRKMIFQEKVKF